MKKKRKREHSLGMHSTVATDTAPTVPASNHEAAGNPNNPGQLPSSGWFWFDFVEIGRAHV